MAEETPSTGRYSYLAQLRDRLNRERDQRMQRLRPSDLKAVLAYLEAAQLHIAFNLPTADDPVVNAKYRGQVELLLDLQEDIFLRLQEMTRPEVAPTEESDDE